MATPPPPPSNIAEITAPLLLGIIWNWTLYGALVVQLYVYSYNFPDDRRFIKVLVYSVFILETVQTALTGADAYYWFISGFGNLSAYAVGALIGGIRTAIVGQFFKGGELKTDALVSVSAASSVTL
ncbi:hypothetical protein BC834DRAFT_974856 [Gloeopeniophorella convolvens]|nr:hypothetical protein BC834DRAFT_974856 [Gloeopeniophorella convolvens]